MDSVLRCSCVSATLTPYHQAHVGVEEFLVLKQRGQFAVGQRPDGGIIGILQGFQASREVAGKHLRAEDVAVARIRAERLLHEVVRVARGIQFLKPGLAQDIGGASPRGCRRALPPGSP